VWTLGQRKTTTCLPETRKMGGRASGKKSEASSPASGKTGAKKRKKTRTRSYYPYERREGESGPSDSRRKTVHHRPGNETLLSSPVRRTAPSTPNKIQTPLKKKKRVGGKDTRQKLYCSPVAQGPILNPGSLRRKTRRGAGFRPVLDSLQGGKTGTLPSRKRSSGRKLISKDQKTTSSLGPSIQAVKKKKEVWPTVDIKRVLRASTGKKTKRKWKNLAVEWRFCPERGARRPKKKRLE